MHYVIADIHGCYNEYLMALEAVGFSDKDTLYVLGDSIDKGYAPVELLQDMMSRPNVVPILGNHEYMAYKALGDLFDEGTDDAPDEGAQENLAEEHFEFMMDWLADGGNATFEALSELSIYDQELLFDYISEFSIYEEVSAGGKHFLLVHGGLEPFKEGSKVEDYSLYQLLESRVNLEEMYFKDKITITGHTPTYKLEAGNAGTIIKKNNHIALDCGCVYGGNLAIYCLETDEVKYIPSTLRN